MQRPGVHNNKSYLTGFQPTKIVNMQPAPLSRFIKWWCIFSQWAPGTLLRNKVSPELRMLCLLETILKSLGLYRYCTELSWWGGISWTSFGPEGMVFVIPRADSLTLKTNKSQHVPAKSKSTGSHKWSYTRVRAKVISKDDIYNIPSMFGANPGCQLYMPGKNELCWLVWSQLDTNSSHRREERLSWEGTSICSSCKTFS